MGGHKETKKSLSQVKADLVTQLTDNARNLLMQKFGITDNTTNLDTLLNKLATSYFKESYQYDYSDEPKKCHPPKQHGSADPKTSAKMCSIIPPVEDQVNAYLKAGVFSKLNLPSWMEQTAISELSNVATAIASSDTAKQWTFYEFKKTYDAKKEDQDSYTCDAILVYCSGSLVEDGTQAQLSIIYYCGVYYEVISDTKGTRDELQGAAYKDAGSLGSGAAPQSERELQNTLEKFAKSKFNSEFHFQYDTDPPDSLKASGVKSAFVTHNSKLRYVPDTQVDDLKDFVNHELFGGINIPVNFVAKKAAEDTFLQFKSILNDASTGSWRVTQVDRTYTSADPTTNPIRQTGIIMSWYDHATSQSQVSISVTYLYIMTMFYELLDPEKQVATELFKILGNNLRRHIQGDDGKGDVTDPITLKDFMHRYATQEFQKTFSFEYKGSQTEPPNKKPGGRVQAIAKLLHLKDYPVTRPEVESWMDNEVFRKDEVKFPRFAVGALYDDIVNHVIRYGGEDTPKDNNWWYPSDFTREYLDPSGSKRDLQQFSFYLYALGEMTLDKPDHKGSENVHIQRLFVYYLGVICSFDVDKAEGDWK